MVGCQLTVNTFGVGIRDACRGVAMGARVCLGIGALTLTLYWVAVSLLPHSTSSDIAFASPSEPVASAWLSWAGAPQPDELGRIEASLGCAASGSAEDLDAFFEQRRGPLIGWDNPHVTELGADRWLWLVHDTYLDYSGRANDLEAVGSQVQNVAFIQDGNCFSLLHRGTPDERLNFERGDGSIAPEHFLWPLGSEVDGDRLWVFWGETASAPINETPPGHGITRHPVATWLASYDRSTLERLSFAPAPNPGVEPVYGFAVASDESHTYLFGNTNQLNFWRNGGYENGPHSATRMYLARVDRGQLDQEPAYWTGTDWSSSAADAMPISDRFYAENTMQPRYLDGRWFSVVQRDGFFGNDVWLEAARDPWGPWVAMDVIEHRTRDATVEKNSYQPIVLPWSSAEKGVQIAISENAVKWFEALEDPSLYRPTIFEVEWPSDSHARIDEAIGRLANS